MGRRADWTDVELIIFPHGALLVVTVDWMPAGGAAQFSLKDLRTWNYLAKFRHQKPGLSQGWTFRTPWYKVDEEMEMRELGMELFEAIYRDEAISLGAIAAWLVKLPDEAGAGNPNRIPLYTYNVHFTLAVLKDEAPPPSELRMLLRQIRHQDGARTRLKDDVILNSDDADVTLQLRSNRWVSFCSEGNVQFCLFIG